MSVLSDAVTSPDDGHTYDFRCPGIDGSPCGPYVSTGWPSQKVARARGQQHLDEHKGLGAAASLEDFRAEHGLAPAADGVGTVRLEDLS